MKLEKGKTYKILGNDVYINNECFKCVQYSELESKVINGKEIAEIFCLSYKHKVTDIYDGIYYSKKNAGSWVTYYIDENFDGLSKIKFDGESSKRVCVSSVVYDKIYERIRVYFKEEYINDNLEDPFYYVFYNESYETIEDEDGNVYYLGEY